MNKVDMLKTMNPFYSVKKRANLWAKYLGRIGNDCQIFHKVSFGSEPYLIEFGDNVKITYGCKFVTHDGGVEVLRVLGKLPNAHLYGRIKVGNNVFIGNSVIVLPGCSIGDNCIIGAGSIVSKSIPSNSIAVGVPARVVSSIDKYFEKMQNKVMYTGGMSEEKKKEYLLNMFKNAPNKFLEK